MKPRTKENPVNFSGFVEGIVDNDDNKSDLDFIDAEIIKEPARILIRD
jgi:hypothetical protein